MSIARPFVNIHCHGEAAYTGEVRVQNLFAGDANMNEELPKYCSIGVHPWYINETELLLALDQVREFAQHPHCVAVGELGLDRVRGPGMDVQKEVMEKQLDVAQTLGLPVIVHCVRAYSELLQLHKERTANVPWVLHGFHGSPEVAEQCVEKGMYLSLGPSMLANPDRTRRLLASVPMSRILLETDELQTSVSELYRALCAIAPIEESLLREHIATNFEKVFGISI